MLKFEKYGESSFDVFAHESSINPMGSIRKKYVDGYLVGYWFYPSSTTYGLNYQHLIEISEKIFSLNKEIQ